MKTCAIPNCSGVVVARGWCARHYSRWQKHGDPEAGRTREGAVLEWLEEHADYSGEDCLKFPFATKSAGYGAVKFRGHIIGAHRAMCFIAHGDPASDDLMAAHSCGNGHEACVNPRHLRWATAKENADDKRLHRMQGKRQSLGKNFDADAIRDIIASRGRVPQKELGRRYGISASMVCLIQKGKRWVMNNAA